MNKITAALDMAGCPNRCKHCWLGHSPNGSVNSGDLYYTAKKFRKISGNFEIASWYREPDFPDNYRELFEIEKKLSDSKSPHFELLSFWRAVRDDQYVPWLKELGVRACQLTLWGGREKTDYYTGRPGAYDEIIDTINILLKNSISPRIQIFVNTENIKDLEIVKETIMALKLPGRCDEAGGNFSLFVHQGSCDGENRKNYDHWVTPGDLNNIPEIFIEYTLRHYKKDKIIDVFGFTEQDLFDKLIEDKNYAAYVSDNPVFYIDRDFNVYPNITNLSPHWMLGNLKKDGVENIIESYKNNKSAAQNLSVTKTISELVRKAGNNKSQRLFGENDYKIFLLNKYCESGFAR